MTVYEYAIARTTKQLAAKIVAGTATPEEQWAFGILWSRVCFYERKRK